jgi:hypothetical protein
MRAEGPGFLQRNAAIADDVRRTLADIDEIEGQLRKAEAAIGKAQALAVKHRARMAGLCDSAAVGRKMHGTPDGRTSGTNGNGTLELQQANSQEE